MSVKTETKFRYLRRGVKLCRVAGVTSPWKSIGTDAVITHTTTGVQRHLCTGRFKSAAAVYCDCNVSYSTTFFFTKHFFST